MSTMNDAQPASLGALIDALAARPADQLLCFDFGGMFPSYVDSYRGWYDHLAIAYESKAPTVAQFLEKLRDADGGRFTGYKGGEYRMGRRTPVWVSNYGEAADRVIVGIAERYDCTVLVTGMCEDWDGSAVATLPALAAPETRG